MDAAAGTAAGRAFLCVQLRGEPLSGGLSGYSERHRDLVPRPTVCAGYLYRFSQPSIAGPSRLGRASDLAEVVGVFGVDGLWVKGVRELLEALSCPLYLVLGVSHR